jgi:hypothetical protein
VIRYLACGFEIFVQQRGRHHKGFGRSYRIRLCLPDLPGIRAQAANPRR